MFPIIGSNRLNEGHCLNLQEVERFINAVAECDDDRRGFPREPRRQLELNRLLADQLDAVASCERLILEDQTDLHLIVLVPFFDRWQLVDVRLRDHEGNHRSLIETAGFQRIEAWRYVDRSLDLLFRLGLLGTQDDCKRERILLRIVSDIEAKRELVLAGEVLARALCVQDDVEVVERDDAVQELCLSGRRMGETVAYWATCSFRKQAERVFQRFKLLADGLIRADFNLHRVQLDWLKDELVAA